MSRLFACSECGHQSVKWHGRCPGCGEWNTLVEQAGAARATSSAKAVRPVPLAEVQASTGRRLSTGIGELDRVLGGGMVVGSIVLLGGPPGIGKSTITTAALANLAKEHHILYVSGEESAAQVKLRAERLGPSALQIPIIAETDLEAVVATLERERPDLCVVDSVQALHSSELASAPGSIAQVREVANRLMLVAKRRGIAVLLVGHVTKDGALAGPRVLEHLVDCVLQLEGERDRSYRMLRALKNRFGATNELGVFEMRESGLEEVADASGRFVADAVRAPGSVILCAVEGSRPLLVELQALVAPSQLVPPRRLSTGVERSRLALVLAVLSRHAGIALASSDVFVSVAGGIRVEEPGADLAIALAVASAARGIPLEAGGKRLAAFGEIGLTGELRSVPHQDCRLAEAEKFGLRAVVAPGGASPTLGSVLARLLSGEAPAGSRDPAVRAA